MKNTLFAIASLISHFVTAGEFLPTVETVAGSGFYGHLDGIGVETMFWHPSDVAVNLKNEIFVADSGANNGNGYVRKIATNGTVTTLGLQNLRSVDHVVFNDRDEMFVISPGQLLGVNGNKALFQIADARISGITWFDGAFYMTTDQKVTKLKLRGLEKTDVAGSGNLGHSDGHSVFSSFYNPRGITVDSVGNLYVTDSHPRTWVELD